MDNFLKKLQSSGFRLTAPRREVLKLLSSTQPLCAQEIYEILRGKGIKVDKVSAYRTLELFEELGFIQKIYLEGKTARYELIGDKHHHHLVCVKCKSVEDVKVEENLIVEQIRKQSEFTIKKHAMEFFGVCANCQN